MTEQRTNNSKKTVHFGNWPSPISAELIAGDSISIDEARQTKHSIYYIERRPTENGRCVIVQRSNNKTVDILPAPYSARSRVHEYGGGSFYADDNLIFFINDSDQDIYLIENAQVTRITENKKMRYADFSYDKHHKRLISICEVHDKNNVTNSFSVELGTVRLKELYFDKNKINEAIEYIDEKLKPLNDMDISTLIGIGGTFRAIATAIMQKQEYPLNKIHAYECSAKDFLLVDVQFPTNPVHC